MAEFDLSQDLADAAPQTWLMFMDETGLADRVSARLSETGHRVVEVQRGDAFAKIGHDRFSLAPELGRSGYEALFQDLADQKISPTRIAHFWQVGTDRSHRPGSNFYAHCQENGFYSLMYLAQVLGEANLGEMHINVIGVGVEKVHNEPLLYPDARM